MTRQELKHLRKIVAEIEVRIYGLNKDKDKEVEENESQVFRGIHDSDPKERTAAEDVSFTAVDVSPRV